MAIDEYADLTTDVGGYLHQTGSQFMGAEFGSRDAPPVETLQSLNLA
jgi:hypothetical protein